MGKRLPPNVGLEVGKSLLYNPYQQEFLKARRARFAPCCQKIGFCGSDGLFRCPSCGTEQTMTAPRVYKRLGCFAGRRGGKSVVGAWGAREELMVPNTLGWVCGPSYEKLHDATMPALLKLIPEGWCKHWDAEHLTLTLVNGAQVAFRSLDDPDRAHSGVGIHWAWLDEAAFISETAWDFLRPSLTDYGGVAFFTSSVDGYDWTYSRVEKPALVDRKPGYWAAKWRTIDNPFMAVYRSEEIADAKATMPPQIFRQEYEGARENFTGSVYAEFIDNAYLPHDDAVKEFIPEWPAIDPNRRIIIGLDSGADHPFGGVAMVVTEKGIVATREYLARQRAFAAHLNLGIKPAFWRELKSQEVLWAANKNEAQMRLEFNAHGVLVAPAENDQMSGIQRVMSWMYTGRFKIAYTCPQVFDQMKRLRFAENSNPTDKQKKDKEKVFKLDDELPDCIRYGLMTWPSLPVPAVPTVGRDLSKMDQQTKWEIEELARKMACMDGKGRDLTPLDKDFPMGNFYGNDEENIGVGTEGFYD